MERFLAVVLVLLIVIHTRVDIAVSAADDDRAQVLGRQVAAVGKGETEGDARADGGGGQDRRVGVGEEVDEVEEGGSFEGVEGGVRGRGGGVLEVLGSGE